MTLATVLLALLAAAQGGSAFRASISGLRVERLQVVSEDEGATSSPTSTSTSTATATAPLTPTLSPRFAGGEGGAQEDRFAGGEGGGQDQEDRIAEAQRRLHRAIPGFLSRRATVSGDTLLRVVEPDGRVVERTVDAGGAVTSERTVGNAARVDDGMLRREPDGSVVRTVEVDGSAIDLVLDPFGRFVAARPAAARP